MLRKMAAVSRAGAAVGAGIWLAVAALSAQPAAGLLAVVCIRFDALNSGSYNPL